MQRSWMHSALLTAVFVVLPAVSGAATDHVSLAFLYRDVSLIVTVTDPTDWQSTGDQDTSQEVGPFDFDADLSLDLALAQAHGIATQHSTISDSGLEASGSLTSSVSAVLDGAASVSASNDYHATFSISEPSSYSLQGTLSATGKGVCTFSFSGEDIEHTFTVEDDSVPLAFSGILPRGTYTLFAILRGSVNVNLDVEAQRVATASFALDLSLSSSIPNESESWGSVKSLFR